MVVPSGASAAALFQDVFAWQCAGIQGRWVNRCIVHFDSLIMIVRPRPAHEPQHGTYG